MKFDEPKQETSGGLFIKLKDGDSVSGVIAGEELVKYKKWENGKTTECDPEDERASFRFIVNMIVNENGGYKAKLLEQGRKVYDQLRELHESGYDLERTTIKITRKGSGLNDTTYTVLPVPNGTLNDKQLESLKEVKLNELK